MQIHVISVFPDLVRAAVSHGLIGTALRDGLWSLTLTNPREFTTDNHHTVDDRPFGGFDGMLMMAEPMARAVEKVKAELSGQERPPRVVHLSPRGRLFKDADARAWAQDERPLVLVASRYAGVDERFVEAFCDEEVSIGDYVVTGGEIPAAIIIDAVLRHRPQILGNEISSDEDSFAGGLIESSQYTRPREWRGRAVPEILLSGDHAKIQAWQWLKSLEETLTRRPDLVRSNADQLEQELAALGQKIRAMGSGEAATRLLDLNDHIKKLWHHSTEKP